MSLNRQYAAAGQAATTLFDTEAVLNVRTDRTFMAKIDPQGYLVLAGALSKDLREKIKFYTLDRVAAAEILETDKLKILGCEFSVLPDSRVDNPASLHISFEAKKIVAGKDL